MQQRFVGDVNTVDLAITNITGYVTLAGRKLVRRGKCNFLAHRKRTQEVACLVCPGLAKRY